MKPRTVIHGRIHSPADVQVGSGGKPYGEVAIAVQVKKRDGFEQNVIPLRIFGNSISIQNLPVGTHVVIDAFIEGREHNGKHYTNVCCGDWYKADPGGYQQPPPQQQQQAPPQQYQQPPQQQQVPPGHYAPQTQQAQPDLIDETPF